uniref:Uncharacterized protein n=1 Tax=Trypanosoma congolense (strain IL3000) TaxID=1068625 RepID=G0UWY7_TRYCI|nr:conserved hypothetical protein [Trypanosoma congolense IL3000]
MFGPLPGDVGEFGSCSGPCFSTVFRYPPLVLYALSIVFLLCLFFSGSDTAPVANILSGAAMICFITARTLRGVLHYLWRERGRITFARVRECVALRAPYGLKSAGVIYMILTDAVFLPLCVAVSAFGKADLLFITDVLYPSHVDYPILCDVIPLCTLLLLSISWSSLLSEEESRSVPLQGIKAFLYHGVLALGAWLEVPTLALLSSMLPCHQNKMSFLSDEECLSPQHHWYIARGFFFLLVYTIVVDIANGSLTTVSDRFVNLQLCDGYLLQLMLAHRLFYIYGAAYFRGVLWCFCCALFSLAILSKLKVALFSSCRVLQYLSKASLMLCALSSICCMAAPFGGYAVYMWLGLLLIGWVLSISTFVRHFGFALCERQDIILLDV